MMARPRATGSSADDTRGVAANAAFGVATIRGMTNAARTTSTASASDQRPAPVSLMITSRSLELKYAHHPHVLVIHDVTVVHPLPREIVESHDDAHRRMRRHVHGIQPVRKRLRHAIAVEHLKAEAVQMKRVVHPHQVLDLPDFRRMEASREIHPREIHHLAIDHPL